MTQATAGFNEESQMPEKASGGDESAVMTETRPDETQPDSGQSTDRFGFQKAGKGYLLRKYNIALSKAGNPYFEPVPTLLAEFVRDADDALLEARARILGDKDLQKRADKLAAKLGPYFNALVDDAGDGREWLAKSLALWPITDQVGYQLYKACSGEADLADYAAYILRTDANVESVADLETHEGFQKRTFWTDIAYTDLAVWDFVLGEVDEDSQAYNLEAIIRSGYQSAASLDTRNHLKGVTGNTPVTDDTATVDVKAQVLASRRIASQAS